MGSFIEWCKKHQNNYTFLQYFGCPLGFLLWPELPLLPPNPEQFEKFLETQYSNNRLDICDVCGQVFNLVGIPHSGCRSLHSSSLHNKGSSKDDYLHIKKEITDLTDTETHAEETEETNIIFHVKPENFEEHDFEIPGTKDSKHNDAKFCNSNKSDAINGELEDTLKEEIIFVKSTFGAISCSQVDQNSESNKGLNFNEVTSISSTLNTFHFSKTANEESEILLVNSKNKPFEEGSVVVVGRPNTHEK